jgi:hypothetical protein
MTAWILHHFQWFPSILKNPNAFKKLNYVRIAVFCEIKLLIFLKSYIPKNQGTAM